MKYEITVMREDDSDQGLATLTTIIKNGLSCITTNIMIEEMSNCITLSFDADNVEPQIVDEDPFLKGIRERD